MRGERSSGQFEISCGYSGLLRASAPAVDCGCDFFNDLFGALRSEPIKPGAGQDRLQAGAVVCSVDAEDMFRLVDIRINVERRRQPPPVRTEHETVVAQVIVPVADRYVEGKPV